MNKDSLFTARMLESYYLVHINFANDGLFRQIALYIVFLILPKTLKINIIQELVLSKLNGMKTEENLNCDGISVS